MTKGHELLHRLHESLSHFEAAVVRREHKKPFLDSAVVLQQAVDDARQHVVQTVIELVRDAKAEYLQP